ncbi:DUF4153 domain-containing protein [Sphingomonas phyllosphaerae]|uniref:DUF4153 domain-containing protein n=1 Tax=Sphingomonas phyllosphaerae TaxID=257003 RepID=UPI000414A866|nr:DUF4173 domain-containing protein [Sphingomonas phyllosphaerae]
MRYSFLVKACVTAGLVLAFDRLFPGEMAVSAIGVFAAAWLIGLVAVRADVRRDLRALVAVLAAALFATALIDDPGPLAWTMFWCALSVASLIPRTVRFDDAWRWAARLVVHAASSAVRPWRDLRQGLRRPRGKRRGARATLAILAFPLIGGALFLGLFAAANPLIADALAAIELPSLWQVVIWAIVGCGIWPSLRPHPAVLRVATRLPDPEPVLPGTSLPSVLIALALFNALFAVQNALDIAFLWSGGPLPAGMTQTGYVHRGAYPLIVTALIAGVMALAMLRPGSASEQHPWARRMVVLWVAQNLILVASSVWRTIDYIEASMLTEWRIAALAWMALVALGLATICWRIIKRRSARWLVNWNAAAALAVLTPCTFLDLGAIAAEWNVRHRAPAAIDLCYLATVGDGALLPMIQLERRPMDATTRAGVHFYREWLLGRLHARQSAWQTWTPRGARRLTQAKAALGRSYHPAWPVNGDNGRPCDAYQSTTTTMP